MGIIDIKDIGSAIESLTKLPDRIRSGITGELTPELKVEIEKAELSAKQISDQLQSQINLEYAKKNFFYSAPRALLLWICVIAFCYTYIALPVLSWFFKMPDFKLDNSELNTLLFGLLGLAAARSIEKIKDSHNKH